MNVNEAAQVLAVMAAPHPWDVDDDQAEIWYRAALEGCAFEFGLEVAIRLVETEERFPTPARFNKERTAIEQERYTTARRAAEASERLALDAATVDPDERARWFAEMRASLAKMSAGGSRGHWHGGLKPCPVCGGIAPDLRSGHGVR